MANRRERRAADAQGLTVDDSSSYQGAVRGTVSYGVAGAPTTITIGQLQFVRPERSFPADCGAARLRLGSPELHFAQLDPFNDQRMVRALILRFERHRFVERAKANEPFRLDVEKQVEAQKPTGKRQSGEFAELFSKAKLDGSTGMIDAEFDLISYSGGRAGLVALATPQNQLASALVARSNQLFFEPVVEVTMTTALLADLLLSWKTLAESIQ